MKTGLIVFITFFILSNVITGQVPDSIKFNSLRPADFQQALQNDDKPILIDVREFFEYRKSRLHDAVNIPSSGNLEISADTLKKESSLFLYCTSGVRSKRVAKYFHDKGFLKLYSLDGGIVQWKKMGFPVDRRKIRR